MKNVQKVGFRAAHLVDDGIGRTGTVRGVNLLYLQERPMRWTGLLREELAGACVGFFHWIRPSSSFLLGGRAAAGRRSGAVGVHAGSRSVLRLFRGPEHVRSLWRFAAARRVDCFLRRLERDSCVWGTSSKWRGALLALLHAQVSATKLSLPSWVGEKGLFWGTSPLCRGWHSISSVFQNKGFQTPGTPIDTDRLKTAGRSSWFSRLQRGLATLDNTWVSRELRACTPSQSPTEGNGRVLKANNKNTLPFSSFQ